MTAPLLLLLLLAACDPAVNPIVGEERPFTVWGFLDATADTQRVRVFAVEDRLGDRRGGSIDAVVTSTDLTTGAARTWTDEEVTFADGTVGHVFWAPFRAQHGHRYRLTVTRSDGAKTTATVSVPHPVTVEMATSTTQPELPVVIRGTPPQLVGVAVEYEILTVPPSFPWPPGTPAPPAHTVRVVAPYADVAERIEGGWAVRLDLQRDIPLIRDAVAARCLNPDLIALRRARFRFLAADSSWAPPGGDFDPEVLIQPGVFSNVENGFGFFGAGVPFAQSWVAAEGLQAELGFRLIPPCARGPADLPECQVPDPPCLDG
ncbi:MAG: hypothetical protein R3247_05120 [Rhodothermales bacterium]|nr:hypothetical protein [Rhodothermales bacterium]